MSYMTIHYIGMREVAEFLLRDTEESEFHDLVDFEDVAFSVETVIRHPMHQDARRMSYLYRSLSTNEP